MAIKDVMQNALNTNWTLTDNFEVYMANPAAAKYFGSLDIFKDSIEKSLMTIDAPTLTSAEADNILGGERRLGVRMFEAFRFTMKFRDFNGGYLRRFFEGIWMAQQYKYPKDIQSSVSINQDTGNGEFDSNIVNIFRTSNALITSVSALNFDNSSTQIAEFDVTFIANKYSNEDFTGFGESTFIDNFRN